MNNLDSKEEICRYINSDIQLIILEKTKGGVNKTCHIMI